MYEKDADGRLFFADNALHRYSIGDRTPGVRRASDGSIELLLQHDAPPEAGNWLPAPNGPIYLVLRLYWPKTEAPSILPAGEGSWSPPGIVRSK